MFFLLKSVFFDPQFTQCRIAYQYQIGIELIATCEFCRNVNRLRFAFTTVNFETQCLEDSVVLHSTPKRFERFPENCGRLLQNSAST